MCGIWQSPCAGGWHTHRAALRCGSPEPPAGARGRTGGRATRLGPRAGGPSRPVAGRLPPRVASSASWRWAIRPHAVVPRRSGAGWRRKDCERTPIVARTPASGPVTERKRRVARFRLPMISSVAASDMTVGSRCRGASPSHRLGICECRAASEPDVPSERKRSIRRLEPRRTRVHLQPVVIGIHDLEQACQLMPVEVVPSKVSQFRD